MTQSDITHSLDQEEKIMTALAHISILLPFMGLIAPIVIWVTQKDKSSYINFQALQAIAYQVSFLLLWFIIMGCYMCSFFGMFFIMPAGAILAEGGEETVGAIMALTFFVPFTIIFTAIGLFLLIVVYGIIGAIMTLQGRDFQYIFIGKKVKQFMEK